MRFLKNSIQAPSISCSKKYFCAKVDVQNDKCTFNIFQLFIENLSMIFIKVEKKPSAM